MSDDKIREAVRKLAGTQLSDEVFLVSCMVESVDEGARTCDCINIEGGAVTDIPNVQLMAEVDDGMLMLPTVGSTVIVLYAKRAIPLVVMFSEVDKVLMISGNSVVSITNDNVKISNGSSSATIADQLIQFNDGSLGGLVKVKDLTTKLNNLEKAYNDLATKFNSHTHILTLSSGTGTAAPTTSPEATTLISTQQADIENTNTKHGL